MRDCPPPPHPPYPTMALHEDGLVAISLLDPNAQAFVKYKSITKCALIIDVQAFNSTFSH